MSTIARLALVLSFSVGFLSLSQEILWVRLVSFGQQGRPQAFSIVLAAFLVGIALGAIVGRRLCAKSAALARSAAWVLLLAATVDLALMLVASDVLTYSARRLPLLAMLISLTAGLKGILFPIVHHLGSDEIDRRVGRSISRIYFGNVIGSSLGPLVTGFWLLDHIDIEQAFALVGTLTAALGVATLYVVARPHRGFAWAPGLVLLTFGSYATFRPPNIIEPLALAWDSKAQVKHVIQNKHGILHVLAEDEPHSGDITYGGNDYDGRIATDMSRNSNGLDRAYVMALMHPQPKRVLVIGLSTGAWTQVLLGLPGIEQVDVVEINPGYLELMKLYPEVAGVLSDPRVHIQIDDGRRWLRRNPDAQYDLILQNTTHHWRAYSSMLLSVEYLQEVRRHLRPSGLIALNTTRSADAYQTALAMFQHVVRYKNFVYMSEHELTVRVDAEAFLKASRIGLQPAFPDALFLGDGLARQLTQLRPESALHYLDKLMLNEAPRVITDLNLMPEFRHGLPPLFGILNPLLPKYMHRIERRDPETSN